MRIRAALLFAFAIASSAQTPQARSLPGTVTAVRAESSEIEIKPDTGPAITVKTGASTIAQKIAPGQTDLSKAEPIKVSDVIAGDRVLVTLGPDAPDARRIVVIAATDLAKRDAADRLDWQRRGVAGVVTAVTASDFSVETRSLGSATNYTVTAGPKTTFKRYSPDSVKFADARNSGLAELKPGDQVRARGQKSADGLKVEADDVVFGTFLSKAGTISAINPVTHEITIKDLGNKNKPIAVKFTGDSQIKRMPDAAAMTGMLGAGRAGRGGRGPGGPDIAQMLELLPPVKFEDLKSGEVAVVSAIEGEKPDQITAITFLANAETLVQLAMAARGAGATGPAPSLAGLASSISNVGP
jgi:hypothetical protein